MENIAEQFEYALQPIKSFIDNPTYTDIHINGADKSGNVSVFTKARGKRCKHVVPMTQMQLMTIAKHAAVFNKNRINDVTPIAGGMLPDGKRVHVVVEPAMMSGGAAIAIRTQAVKPLTRVDLVNGGIFSQTKRHHEIKERHGIKHCLALYNAGNYDEMIMQAFIYGLNVVFVGQMNTGKTTNMLAYTMEIPMERRIATIEDTSELHAMPHENSIHFHYPKDKTGRAQHTPENCIEACLRMDFDEMLTGEVRDGAAWALARVGLSGHSIKTSLHAESAMMAPVALAAMAKQHPVGQSIAKHDLEQTFRSLIDIAVFSEVIDGEKKITHIWFDPEHDGKIPSTVLSALEEER